MSKQSADIAEIIIIVFLASVAAYGLWSNNHRPVYRIDAVEQILRDNDAN